MSEGKRINYLHQLAIKADSKFTLFLFLVHILQFDFNNNSYFFKVTMEVTKEHIRHILLYEFNKGNNATESARNIKAVYGDRTISIS